MYWWTDDMGVTHQIWQGEGGEQGDPFVPALYACGQHHVLVHVSEDLLDMERLFIYGRHSREQQTGSHGSSLDLDMWEHARI